MKTSLWLIVKIELLKFFKRYDIFSVFAIVAVGIIYAVGMRDESYKGVENQSALFWIVLQLLTATVLFISPVVNAFLGTQTLSSEIDNKSISLYTIRVRNRKRLYLGKSIFLMLVSLVFFAFTLVVMFGVYMWIESSGSKFVSGTLFGNNSAELLCMLLLVYMYCFFLIPQIALSLGVRMKPLTTIVACFGLVVLFNHVMTYSFPKYFNPMGYIYGLAYDVLETVEPLDMDKAFVIRSVCLQICLCLFYYAIATICGIKNFEKKEL